MRKAWRHYELCFSVVTTAGRQKIAGAAKTNFEKRIDFGFRGMVHRQPAAQIMIQGLVLITQDASLFVG
jgi:hypothetical protein